jgi:antitoxin PrlF
MVTTVNSRGEVTIPNWVCDHLGIGPGSRAEFRLGTGGSIIVAKADDASRPTRLAKLVGIAGPGMTTDELMALLRGEPE